MQTSLFENIQLNEAHQPPLQQCSVMRSGGLLTTNLIRMKKYKIIYADPAWKISYYPRENRKKMKWDNYPTMKLEDIKSLPVNDITADNSVLFLWTTNTFLPQAFEVIKEWGFKYHCTIVWKKDNGITMRGVHRTVEFLLFAYKGAFPNIGSGKPLPCHVEHKRGKHSEKPNIFREIILNKFGDLPRLEMFARQNFEGWDAWGNEVAESVNLETSANNGR